MLVATIIQGLIILNNPNYVPQGWHGTLLTIGIVLYCVLFNTYGARRLPLVEGSLAVLHFGGMFVILVILWYVKTTPQNARSLVHQCQDQQDDSRHHNHARSSCKRPRQVLTGIVSDLGPWRPAITLTMPFSKSTTEVVGRLMDCPCWSVCIH